jgi:ribose transport system substrate-binding protein
VAEAVARLNMQENMVIIGTDGIKAAHDAIQNGKITATIESFPYVTGLISVEIALRVLEGQQVPKVVYSPHQLITQNNLENNEDDVRLFKNIPFMDFERKTESERF